MQILNFSVHGTCSHILKETFLRTLQLKLVDRTCTRQYGEHCSEQASKMNNSRLILEFK